MRGVITGMLRTLDHLVRPRPITRKYPYEKRELPERSRGLIALLLEPETDIFKCESCLMCEKACPPRAISISYKFRGGFRKRPLIAPRASYYRIRMVASAPYGARRPLSTVVTTIPAEEETGGAQRQPLQRRPAGQRASYWGSQSSTGGSMMPLPQRLPGAEEEPEGAQWQSRQMRPRSMQAVSCPCSHCSLGGSMIWLPQVAEAAEEEDEAAAQRQFLQRRPTEVQAVS